MDRDATYVTIASCHQCSRHLRPGVLRRSAKP